MHRFDPKDSARLDDEWRRNALPPLRTLQALGVRESDTLLDIGCGIGYFTFPAADFIGPTRKVFALDVSEGMLDEMDRRVHVLGATNVVALLSDGYDWKLPDGSVTFVLCAAVLHEVEARGRFLDEAKRVLKPGGRIGIVEWTKADPTRGPSPEERLDPTEVAALLHSAGFIAGDPISVSEPFYGIVGTSPIPSEEPGS